MCAVAGGGRLNALSALRAASMRNMTTKETSSMCFVVRLPPAECNFCLKTLTKGKKAKKIFSMSQYKLTDYNAPSFGLLVFLDQAYSQCSLSHCK